MLFAPRAQAFGVAAGAFDKVAAVVGKVTPFVKPVADRAVAAATPVGKAVVGVAGRTVGPVLSEAQTTATGAVTGAVGAAGQALKVARCKLYPSP